MSYDEYSADRVRRVFTDLLPHHRDVVEMRMMGGLAFILNGNLCCGISNRGLMARVGVAVYDDAILQPHAGPLGMGARIMVGYLRVAPEGIDADVDLERWMRLAVGFVSTLPVKAGKKKKAKRSAVAAPKKKRR